MSIPMTELARRLCVGAHRADLGGGAGFGPTTVPCSRHLEEARRYWGLIQPSGQATLDVVVQAAEDGGERLPR